VSKKINYLEEMSGTPESWRNAEAKAERIIKIISSHKNMKTAVVLDDGCGYGYNSLEFAKHAKKVFAIDINKKAVSNCIKLKKKHNCRNLFFQQEDGERVSFEDNFFDIVISYQVLEHVSNQKKYLSEAHRILKPGGLIYLAVPNKLSPIEVHFKIPFMGIMPGFLADAFAKARGAKKFDVHSHTFHGTEKMLAESGFNAIDYTSKIIQNPTEFGIEKDIGSATVWLAKLLKPLAPLIKFFSPTFVFVGIKA